MVTPGHHAARGATGAFIVATALANAIANRQVLTTLLQHWTVKHWTKTKPSRNVAALVVFVGTFRYLQRRASIRAKQRPRANGHRVPGVTLASALASGLGTMCLSPTNRPALISFLSTHTVSQLVHDLITNHPELHLLKLLELLVFVTAVGWIYYSGFFHPESYERSHMKLILKYVLLTQSMAEELQSKYREGLNPSPCTIRHKGLSCSQFARSDFLQRVMSEAFQLYFPVHFSAWLFAQRHATERAKPISTRIRRFVAKLFRSTAYFTTFVYLGWVLSCRMKQFGDHSLSRRKLQFFVGGALPSLAIFIESPSRRRPIGLILTSYVLISMGNVAFRHIPWLQPGAGSTRGLLEASCVAAAMAMTMSELLESNYVVRRILLGGVEARALQEEFRQAKETEAEKGKNQLETIMLP